MNATVTIPLEDYEAMKKEIENVKASLLIRLGDILARDHKIKKLEAQLSAQEEGGTAAARPNSDGEGEEKGGEG